MEEVRRGKCNRKNDVEKIRERWKRIYGDRKGQQKEVQL